jgi:hypothetical protein
MQHYIYSLYHSLNLRVSTIAWTLYIVAAVLIVLLGLQPYVTPRYFTQDVATLTGGDWYYGAISTIGMLLWCATAAICLFGAVILRKSGMPKEASFLRYAGLLSIFLLLDDQFLLHESVFPQYFGIPEMVIVALYPVFVSLYLLLHYKQILHTQVLVLISALGFLALSIVVDVVIDQTYVEDSLKFFGIVGWFSYQLRTVYILVCKAITRQKASQLQQV